jgi:hypothetical protein
MDLFQIIHYHDFQKNHINGYCINNPINPADGWRCFPFGRYPEVSLCGQARLWPLCQDRLTKSRFPRTICRFIRDHLWFTCSGPGLLMRLASVPLIIIMLVAIATTKADVLANDGFWEMMHGSRTDWAMFLGGLFLLIKGCGRWSVDQKHQ